MEDLQSVMSIIDRYTEAITEGDYLELCNKLRDAYNKRTDPVYMFDYENFSIPPVGPDNRTLQYFYDTFYERAVDFDSDFVNEQLAYLTRELEMNQPLKRISPRIKEQVKYHYCRMQNISRSELDESTVINHKDFKITCRTFLYMENAFRSKYRDGIEQRIQWLMFAQDDLATI